MKISACYIVKNEATTLPVSLASLAEYVDEIIVIDTGSTDETVKIVKEYGAAVFHFPWQNDFSAARNYALDKAVGEWIIFLDADEYFTSDTAVNLRTVLEKYDETNRRGGLLIPLYNIDTDKGNEVIDDTLTLRIFYKKPGYRYEGIIHEELCEQGEPIRELYVVSATDLKLMHTGYSSHLSIAKAKRNLKLLLQELSATSHPERLYMYLADAYWGLDEKEKARYYAQLDVDNGRRATTYASRSYRILLQLSVEDGDDLNTRLQLCQCATNDYPESPEFRADLAECWAALGNYNQAVGEMTLALQNFRNYKGIEPMLFTAEQAELAQKRMEGWQKKMKSVDLTELAIRMRMLLLALVKMDDEHYNSAKSEYEKNMSIALTRILQRFHGAPAQIDDSCSREYMDILDMLLTQNNPDLLAKFLAFSGDFSTDVRKQIVEKLDKKIAQEEFSQGVHYD